MENQLTEISHEIVSYLIAAILLGFLAFSGISSGFLNGHDCEQLF